MSVPEYFILVKQEPKHESGICVKFLDFPDTPVELYNFEFKDPDLTFDIDIINDREKNYLEQALVEQVKEFVQFLLEKAAENANSTVS